jgi:hypothetical protein
LVSTARTAWKKPTSSRIAIARSCGTASANALDNSDTALTSRFFPSACASTCSCAAAEIDTAARLAGLPDAPIEPPKIARQTSYFSSITATASSWSIAVSPLPPLSV